MGLFITMPPMKMLTNRITPLVNLPRCIVQLMKHSITVCTTMLTWIGMKCLHIPEM